MIIKAKAQNCTLDSFTCAPTQTGQAVTIATLESKMADKSYLIKLLKRCGR